MLAKAVGIVEILIVLIYLSIVVCPGWLRYNQTKTTIDYLLAGCRGHSFNVAISYKTVFISINAILGFGGVTDL